MCNEISGEFNSANNSADDKRKPDERKFLITQNADSFKGRIYSLLVCLSQSSLLIIGKPFIINNTLLNINAA